MMSSWASHWMAALVSRITRNSAPRGRGSVDLEDRLVEQHTGWTIGDSIAMVEIAIASIVSRHGNIEDVLECDGLGLDGSGRWKQFATMILRMARDGRSKNAQSQDMYPSILKGNR